MLYLWSVWGLGSAGSALAADDGAPALAALDARVAESLAAAHEADTARAAGRAQEALRTYEIALETLKGGQNPPPPLPGKRFEQGTAVVSDLYFPAWPADLATRPDAAAYLETALPIAIGNLYLDQQQIAPADQRYREALALADAGAYLDLQLGVRANLAWLALRSDTPAAAEPWFADLARLDPGQLDAYREVYLAQAVWRARTDPERALVELSEVRARYTRAGDGAGARTAWLHTAEILRIRGDLDGALTAYESAAALVPGDPAEQWPIDRGLFEVRAARGDRAGALQAGARYLDALDALASRYGTDEGQYSLVEAHRSALDSVVRVAADHAVATDNPDLARRFAARARERSLPALLTARADGPTDPPGVRSAESLGLVTLDDVVVQRAVGVSLGAPARRPLPADVPASPLAGGTGGRMPFAALEFYQLDSSLLIWLTEPSGTVWMVERPLARDTVGGMVKRLRRALAVPTVEIRSGNPAARGLDLAEQPKPERPFAAVSRRAWRAWIGGVEKHLPAYDVPLVIVPHGALWHVPFAALQSPRGDWLGQWPLTEATSAESVAALQARPRRAPQRALVVGNPGTERIAACGQDLHWRPLRGAEAEAKAIASRPWTKVDLLLGAQADPLRVGAWHGAYDVLHFATHGMVCPDTPLESFVLMATPPIGRWSLGTNGTLWRTDDPRLPITVRDAPPTLDGLSVPAITTAREVIDHWRLDADLVTLSACETGLGPISSEGTIGLTRAFLAAGARSLLVSLWEVDDAATRDLMVAFYDGYLAHGDKARALRDAAAAVRRDHPDPRLWAAFTLVGAP